MSLLDLIRLLLGQSSEPAAPPAAPQPVPATQPTDDGLTVRGMAELVGHEAIVQEAYKDSQGIWTWGIGVTDASGHMVERYIDHPQSIVFCLQIFVWLVRSRYLPAVQRAFAGHELNEAQLHAALSFHYNTGQIEHASWVELWKEGQQEAARASFMTWDHPSAIVERRQKECNLFFDGTWSGDGMANVLPVLKPSYQPDFHHPVRLDVTLGLQAALGAGA